MFSISTKVTNHANISETLELNATLKVKYSEKATKFSKSLLLSYIVLVKYKVDISQNFVAFSEYIYFNFKNHSSHFLTVISRDNFAHSRINNSKIYFAKERKNISLH